MYFDNLTIAGLAVAAVTALIPLFFGRELFRVREDESSDPAYSSNQPEASESVVGELDCATAPEACS